jgi:aspartate aminotransferase-like enzyme
MNVYNFVVRVAAADGAAELRRRNTECQRARRARFVAAGLTVLGQPRRRSPNGTRKSYHP